MKTSFCVFAICISAICNAQQKQPKTTKVKFIPPVIVKDTMPAKSTSRETVTFIPPTIVKDQPLKNKTPTTKKVKFTPPVIVKDSVKQ